MKIDEIKPLLQQIFGSGEIKQEGDDNWQVEQDDLRLLVILSEDRAWLRILIPIIPLAEAQPFLVQLLAANFDLTQEVRYAIEQNVLWGVFFHRLESLVAEDFCSAIAILIALKQKGLGDAFQQLIEQRIRQIVKASKAQGQSLEDTYKTLERFYQEGMLGDLDRDPQERENFLAAWRYQLERLWSEVE
ncbi:MAG: hypothetical protein AB4368_06520 [Xenococcaceae cyanobacterium]